MPEKLIVKNFAGIKELEIEVRKINILIGPQASGKSVCAKLLFYFKSFIGDILSTVVNEQTKRDLNSNYSKKFEEYFPSNSLGNNEFFIRYQISDVFIEISKNPQNKGKVLLTYSDFYKQLFDDLRNYIKKEKKKASKDKRYEALGINISYLIIGREYLTEYMIKDSLGIEAQFVQLFIPAGRSFFANLQSNIFSFISSNNALDPFLRDFGSTYENMKGIRYRLRSRIKNQSREEKDIQDEIDRLVEKALCGKHIHEKGKDFLEIADGRRISIANSSSGQQETLPLAIMLATLPFFINPRSSPGRTVYIEEPEAHLFPSAQRDIIDLIATVFNQQQDQLQFFITTHSPYTLTAINNLLQAGILYNQADENALNELEKIVPRYKALMTKDLSAYTLADGKCCNIICPDTGLIDAKVIDAVSDELAIEFDKLLNLA
ncbi:AAA family ATPase [Microcoleus sp. FACHB-68]|uniref:AAA family ATPase n=1 Tax=Microcoleus sp. FACHB-68 TaxID=2692826 RepID=UPI001685434D|nr:AAA family ATPase [Microcoleus sp. FACHB-68]MBD1936430.1 AAA family ATPase [Microcoleus sp. FACHB-68]